MVKNILKKLLFPFILLFAFVAVGAAQDIQTNIGNAIKGGNSKDIAKFFDKRVEVIMELIKRK